MKSLTKETPISSNFWRFWWKNVVYWLQICIYLAIYFGEITEIISAKMHIKSAVPQKQIMYTSLGKSKMAVISNFIM